MSAPGHTHLRTRQIAAALGVDLEAPTGGWVCADIQGRLPIAPGAITAIVGPSGSGKTRLLGRLEQALTAQGRPVIREPKRLPRRATAELVGSSPLDAMDLLTRVGLGEHRCFLATPDELSDGQRARLRLLIALGKASACAGPNPVLILDELASALDDHSARAAAFVLARAVRRTGGIAAVVATHRLDLLPILAPAQLVRLSIQGHATIEQAPFGSEPADPLPTLRIEPGDATDLAALSHLHYRAGKPRVVVRILRAVVDDELAGVLSVSMPTLNARWRDQAWPGRYRSTCKTCDARRINAELRRISRVIVDPRFRAMGVARRLVHAYLDDPLSPCTESVSALGASSGFFARAGMTPYPLTPSLRDARLLDALHCAGVEPSHLSVPRLAYCTATRNAGKRFIDRELLRWASSSRSAAPVRNANGLDILRRAARTLAGAPVAYACTSRPP